MVRRTGEIPQMVRSSKTSAKSAARRRLCENCLSAILPLPDGGLLLRAFGLRSERRTHMNYIILVVIVIAIFGSVMVAALAKEFRHAFLVPEGYAGLLYHKGKFVETLGAGRHI